MGSRELRQATVAYIQSELQKQPQQHIYNHYNGQTNAAVGPWPKPMWEIQLCTVDVNATPTAPQALDIDGQMAVHQFMLRVAEFLKQEINNRKLKGSLLIHANTWPINSNQVLERELHFGKACLLSNSK